MNIQVTPHKDALGKNPERHAQITGILKPIITQYTTGAELEAVDVYNLLGSSHAYNAGNAKRLVIYVNGTSGASEWNAQEKCESIAGSETPYQIFLPPSGDGIIITSEGGLPIAEYKRAHNELNILFQMDEAEDDVIKSTFDYIMSQYHELVVKPILVQHSWKFTQDKASLTERFVNKIKETKSHELREDRRRLERWEHEIRDYTSAIKSAWDNVLRTRQNLENADKLISEAETRLLGDLDLIVAHPKVTDLQIKDGKFMVFTDDIYCHHDKTGDRYYMGKYRIELQPERTSVKWFNLNNARNGYFSGGKNQHPHINAQGEACMGNISATLAELSSRMELYALVLMAIDFVESVNTSDVAGRKITNWDKVDADGKIIPKPDVICPNCGSNHGTDESQLRTAYRLDEDGDLGGTFEGCEECTEWDDDRDEYVEVQE